MGRVGGTGGGGGERGLSVLFSMVQTTFYFLWDYWANCGTCIFEN